MKVEASNISRIVTVGPFLSTYKYLQAGVGTGPGPCPGKFSVPGTESRNLTLKIIYEVLLNPGHSRDCLKSQSRTKK